MSSCKRGLIAALMTLTLPPISAGAAGLGEIRVASALGDRFRAEVPLLNPSSAINQGCFQLTTNSPEADGDLPWLADAHIALAENPPRLVITSRKSVVDPVIQLAIYTGCGSYLTRHYVALLSPPKERPVDLPAAARSLQAGEVPVARPVAHSAESTRATRPGSARVALPGETASDMARRLYPRSTAAQQRFVRQMVALNPEWLASAAGDEVLPDGDVLKYPLPPPRRPAAPKAPAKPKSVAAGGAPADAKRDSGGDRLVLSPVEPPAEPTAEMASPEEINKRVSNVEVQIGAMRTQLNALRAEYPSPPPAVQALLAEMETRLLAVELNVARINLASIAAERTAVAPAPASVEVAKAVEAGEAKDVPAPTAAVVAPKPVEPAKAAASPGGEMGFMLFGILGLGVGLSVFLYRRSSAGRGDDPGQDAVAALPGPAVAADRSPRARADVAVPPARAQSEEKDTQPAPAASPAAPSVIGDDPEEVEQPVELADIMLVYGQTQGAVDVLRNFAEAHPRESLRCSLRLLEVYKHAAMRDEFESLAAELPRRFNVERANWDTMRYRSPDSPEAGVSLDEKGPATLVTLLPPSIRPHVLSLWGRAECLAYLRKLLHDRDDAGRKVLSLTEAQVVLGLTRLLKRELSAKSQ